MRLSDLDYHLPDDLVAQHPVEPRDSARLLVDRGSKSPDHRTVADLVHLLDEGDLLVVNDSRVIPARLTLQRSTGGAVEVLLLEPLGAWAGPWQALVRPGGKLRPGETLSGPDGDAVVVFEGRHDDGDTFVVSFAVDDAESLTSLLERHGTMPLPPYIQTRDSDPARYQTVYAARPGSAAAPTAGLHFTDHLLDDLSQRGVRMARVELVVGLDTFQPIQVDDPLTHRIHTERYSVPEATLEATREARRVVAVGTTSVRSLETAAATGRLSGRTDLFIHRGHSWRMVDVMMTNFHMPRTTLLLMIDSFVGDRWRRLYETAVAERYRFLSFGDAMLLDRSLD